MPSLIESVPKQRSFNTWRIECREDFFRPVSLTLACAVSDSVISLWARVYETGQEVQICSFSIVIIFPWFGKVSEG